MMIHDVFSCLHAYIFPNEHPMPMKLKNISDESEYTVDDRQYFAQTYTITLMGYIIRENDFDIEVKPIVSLHCIGGDIQRKKPQVEIEEFELINTCSTNDKVRKYQPMKITISFNDGDANICEFTMDCNMIYKKIYTENIIDYSIKCNDEEIIVDNDNEVNINENDIIQLKINRRLKNRNSMLVIEGFNFDINNNIKNDNIEIEIQ
jgi:hypothetical protein